MHFRLSFSHKLFLSVVVLFWFFAGCFIFYQYMRECDYKVELLNDRLAITNTHIATMIEPGCDYDSIVRHLVRTSHFDDLRVTLMDAKIAKVFHFRAFSAASGCKTCRFSPNYFAARIFLSTFAGLKARRG